ncbi:hypothetical protein ACP4OV_002092 [Aristida adscensionis]
MLQALGTLLPKFAKLLKDEYDLPKSVKKDIGFLERELESSQASLRKVGEVPPEQRDEQVKIWARDVRELSYDMEDVVDRFLVCVQGPDPPSKRSFKRFTKELMKIFTKGKGRHRIAEEIRGIKERVKDVAERRYRYKVDTISPATTSIDPRIMALYTKATDLIGVNEAKEEIITLLTQGDDLSFHQQRMISIVGFGGLGKTTLAKVVYDEFKGHFGCTAFISLSRNPNLKRFFGDMLYELDKGVYGDIHSRLLDEKQLIDLIRAYLMEKSCTSL